MSKRGFALLLFVYLSLDVANPFMPGVVRFADGSLDVVVNFVKTEKDIAAVKAKCAALRCASA